MIAAAALFVDRLAGVSRVEQVTGYPPNIDAIQAVFGDQVRDGATIFAYAPHVYVPSGRPLPALLQAHEAVHLQQQGDNPAGWWGRYLADEQFRLEQEVEAHRAEWECAKQTGHRDLKARIARRLSSPLYGSMMSFPEALRAIG